MSLPVRYEIEHISRYLYEWPVRNCVMAVCLHPQNDERQQLLRFELSIDPPVTHNAEQDAFGNTKHVFNILREHDRLEMKAQSIVVTLPPETPPESMDSGAWEEIRAEAESFANWDFTHPTELTQPSLELRGFAERVGLSSPLGDPLTSLRELMNAIHDSFLYVPGTTSPASPIDHILETGKGVCQDYAHVMLAVARSWGVPSRYVSGYVDIGGGESGQPTAGATHAWAECKLPGLGWVGFDPTNRCLADHRHVRIGAGRDYRDVAPTRGVLQGGGATKLEVEVRVRHLP